MARSGRWELVAVAVGLGSLGLALFVIAWRMWEALPSAACVLEWSSGGESSASCVGAVESWLARREEEAFRIAGFAPFVAGLVLGAPLLSREIEFGTAQLGFSVGGSRRRWLIYRVAPITAMLVALLAAVAVAADSLEAARYPGLDARNSLSEYGSRGLPMIGRGIAAFAVAVLAGLVIGRQFAALIGGGLIVVALAYAFTAVTPLGGQWRWMSEAEYSVVEVADRIRDGGFRNEKGLILTYRQALERAPDVEDPGAWVYDNFTVVQEVLRGDQLGVVEANEALLSVAVTVAMLGFSLVVIDRRRPY